MLPLTRKENWLAKIAGDPDADENMKPRTREEYFLNEIAENGGGGGGGGAGLPPVTAADNGKVLGVVNGAWAADSRGYTVETTESIIVPQQSVTTEEHGGQYGSLITVTGSISEGDVATVAFEGVEYEVTAQKESLTIYLGEQNEGNPVFSTYPFYIVFGEGSYMLAETGGTYTVKVEKTVKSADVDDDFALAVKVASSVLVVYEDTNYTLNKTWQEIHDADLAILVSRDEYSSGSRLVKGTSYDFDEEMYLVTINEERYTAATPDSYPKSDIV